MIERTVLLTGAAGQVARHLLPGLSGYARRLVDVVQPLPAADPPEHTDVRVGDLADRAFATEVVQGVDTVVHLAANPRAQASWDALRTPNVDLVATILDAAQRADVRRVILASSVHAMGGYVQQEQHPVDPFWPPSPCCAYGATKAFAEALGRTYSYRTGLSVVCLRFGAVQDRPFAVGSMPSWLAPADLRHLVVRAIEAADVRFGVYHGVSANTRHEWDTSNARAEIGYAPTGDSEVFFTELDPNPRRSLCPRGPVA
ncbi:NAD-dependent epimerase/dehydratase family protein [Actinopolymorpha alba]|uniref:NAD-dependent epimerase/dehydratase family protein n=1 Tax=Actinopolymorpha alba TaxID=533267 RepID=UPI00038121E1|nr:NAD(P)-dependent oxidoreductase [Actinopolymorpha alba]